MDADRELLAYIQALIDHYLECTRQDCPECAVMQGTCDYMRDRIFRSVAPSGADPVQPVAAQYCLAPPGPIAS